MIEDEIDYGNPLNDILVTGMQNGYHLQSYQAKLLDDNVDQRDADKNVINKKNEEIVPTENSFFDIDCFNMKPLFKNNF